MQPDFTKAMVEIAMLFHGQQSSTLKGRLLDVVTILTRVGYVKESAGLIVLTQRAEERLGDLKARQDRLNKGPIVS